MEFASALVATPIENCTVSQEVLNDLKLKVAFAQVAAFNKDILRYSC